MAANKGQLYAVDDILACKRVRGKFYYRIRWSGYGAADDTWEGEECFTAGSLSHFRPRLNALEQLWLNSGSNRRRRGSTRRSPTAHPRVRSDKKTTKATKGKARGSRRSASQPKRVKKAKKTLKTKKSPSGSR